MTRRERFAIWLSWHLPRSVVGWCYVRVAVHDVNEYPGDQRVSEPLRRWLAQP